MTFRLQAALRIELTLSNQKSAKKRVTIIRSDASVNQPINIAVQSVQFPYVTLIEMTS